MAVTLDLSVKGASRELEAAVTDPDGACGASGGPKVLILNHVVGMMKAWSPAMAEEDGYGPNGERGFLENMFAINTFAYMRVANALLPHLEARNGSLTVVSSAVGMVGAPMVVPYSASKHALHGFFDSLRLELALRKSPVSVTVCVLGSIGTEGNKSKTKDRIAVSYAPIDGAAASIVDGSLSRARTTYYPYMLTRASRVASALAPGLVDVNVLEVFRQVFELTNAEADAAAE